MFADFGEAASSLLLDVMAT